MHPSPESPVPTGDTQIFSSYYGVRYCEALLIVYEVASRRSFDALKCYYDNFHLEREQERNVCLAQGCVRTCPPRPKYHGVICVIASKTDRAIWGVSTEEGVQFAASIGATFMAMSAKTGDNCSKDTLVEIVSRALWQRQRLGDITLQNCSNSSMNRMVSKSYHLGSRIVSV
jgi:hypothetical protein